MTIELDPNQPVVPDPEETKMTPEHVEQIYNEQHKLPEPVVSARDKLQRWLDKTFPGEHHALGTHTAGYYAASNDSAATPSSTDYEERAQIRYYDRDGGSYAGRRKLELVVTALDALGVSYQRLKDDYGYCYLLVEIYPAEVVEEPAPEE